MRIDSLEFNGGSVVDTSDADVVVLVGPNNSGKSRTLQEIHALANHRRGPAFNSNQLVVLKNYKLTKLVDARGLVEWLSDNRLEHKEESSQRRAVRAIGFGDFFLDEAEHYWNDDAHLGQLAQQLVRMVGPGDGRGLLGSPGRLEPRQLPDHAIQTLIRNEKTRRAFENAFKGAFHQNLIVDSWGANTRLRLSGSERQEDFAHRSVDGLPSAELADRLAALPLLEAQSDGIRAFSGLLLTLITVKHPVLMLDEPETFLHPPQARLLGEYLGRLRGEGQLFIATHSLDILLGLLQQASARVMVVRLSRRDEQTTALTVDSEAVRTLWRDPLLRFSRALDGLFHEGVVICEGDTDSQFYSAVSYHLAAETAPRASAGSDPAPPEFAANPFDLMFAYAGGKQRIKMIARALSAVSVPVRCVVDFDILNDRTNLESLAESLGFSYGDELERLRTIVDAGIRGREARPRIAAIRPIAEKLLSRSNDEVIDRQTARDIEAALQPPAGWAAAKKKGLSEVPSGEATEAAQQLLEELKLRGIYVVPNGAVESWVKAAGGSSTTWVVNVIERDLIASASDAKEFVGEILKSIEDDGALSPEPTTLGHEGDTRSPESL